jgi:hypothetical protein
MQGVLYFRQDGSACTVLLMISNRYPPIERHFATHMYHTLHDLCSRKCSQFSSPTTCFPSNLPPLYVLISEISVNGTNLPSSTVFRCCCLRLPCDTCFVAWKKQLLLLLPMLGAIGDRDIGRPENLSFSQYFLQVSYSDNMCVYSMIKNDGLPN